MWRRALLAAAAVSYLICVLIMNGMQKEDLDVSILGKLQRHNVNFDDINNEQMRQQCLSRDKEFKTEEQKDTIKENDAQTTEHKQTYITTKDPLSSASLNMDTVINYLKTRDDSVKNSEDITSAKTSTHKETVTNVPDVMDNKSKINMDLLRKYIQLETQKKSFYKIDDDLETTKHDTIINFKTNEKNLNVTDDITVIDKLIKDYIFKKQIVPITTEYATPKFTLDIQSIYKQIDEIIANGSNANNIKDKTVFNNLDKGEQISTKQNNINLGLIPPLIQKRPYPMGKELFESFYNFLNEINQFKINSSQPLLTNNDNAYTKDKKQTNYLLKPFILNDLGNDKEPTTHKSNSEKESDQKALKPLVKEIAESVKKVIMKDLRNELAGIYLKTTQTTTEAITTVIKTTTEITPTTTSSTRTKEKDMAIMVKFMDLYEEIKSLKQATFLLRANNESTTFTNDLKQQNNIPVNNVMFMPPVKALKIPEPKTYISSVDNYNAKPFFNYNSNKPRKEIKHRLPITIQTNSVEIQPLVVPVLKPENLIRQNIVVHTNHRHQGKDDHNFRHLIARERYSDADLYMKRRNRTNQQNPLKRYDGYNSARYPPHNLQVPKHGEDVIRFRMRDNGNSRYDTDYYEKINFGNNHNSADEKHGIFGQRNIPRFHERLERVEPGSDGTPVSDTDATVRHDKNADFPSRYQLSLVDVKKGTSYDDTHFKNFLKTQQKVTDMLEKILATRPKNYTPQSVETA